MCLSIDRCHHKTQRSMPPMTPMAHEKAIHVIDAPINAITAVGGCDQGATSGAVKAPSPSTPLRRHQAHQAQPGNNGINGINGINALKAINGANRIDAIKAPSSPPTPNGHR